MRLWCFLTFLSVAVGLGAQSNVDDLLRTLRDDRELSLPILDSVMSEICQDRAGLLAASGRLNHEDEAGRGVGLQMLSRGAASGTYGEVLGAGKDLSAVWAGWLASPSHRAILLEPGWNRWGWAACPSGATVVWVLRFWKP